MDFFLNWLFVLNFVKQKAIKKRKDECLCHQIGAAGGDELGCLGGTQQAAILKGIADLLVQLVPVGEDHDGGEAGKLPPDLLGLRHQRLSHG